MKNYIRLSVAVLALSAALAACKGNGTGNTGDSTKIDSSASTTKVDTTIKVDTSKKDTAKMADTTNKKTSKTTVEKKSKKSSY